MSTEAERLERGPDAGESAPGDTVTFTYTASDAAATLDRLREVLKAVIPTPRPWPSLDEWKARLPAWFVEACSDDVAISTCVVDKWSLRAWVWWFQPEQRRWTWWDAEASGDRVTLRLTPTGMGSLLLGALEWVLDASGAEIPKK
jgi:hypothetical protein